MPRDHPFVAIDQATVGFFRIHWPVWPVSGRDLCRGRRLLREERPLLLSPFNSDVQKMVRVFQTDHGIRKRVPSGLHFGLPVRRVSSGGGILLDGSTGFRLFWARRANVAQLAEQLTRNEQARSSNLRIGSTTQHFQSPLIPRVDHRAFFMVTACGSTAFSAGIG